MKRCPCIVSLFVLLSLGLIGCPQPPGDTTGDDDTGDDDTTGDDGSPRAQDRPRDSSGFQREDC